MHAQHLMHIPETRAGSIESIAPIGHIPIYFPQVVISMITINSCVHLKKSLTFSLDFGISKKLTDKVCEP